MIVEFSLINATGEEYLLSNVANGHIVDVDGIGGGQTINYQQINNAWIRMSAKNTQINVSGSILVHCTNVYEAEAALTAFLRGSTDYRLKVKTPTTTKYLDVDIASYKLTAVGKNTLLCPINFTGRSLWYTPEERKTIVAVVTNEFRFPVRWPATFNSYSDGYLSINNDGSCEAGFDVEFYGPIDNPVIALEVNNIEVSRVAITASVVSGSNVFYSSRDGDLCCYSGTAAAIARFKQTGDTTGLTNLVSGFSLSNDNFFRIPVGNSRLHITANSTISNNILVGTYKLYRTV